MILDGIKKNPRNMWKNAITISENENSSRHRRKPKGSVDKDGDQRTERDAKKIKAAVSSSRDRLSLDILQDDNAAVGSDPLQRKKRKRIENDIEEMETKSAERRRPPRRTKPSQERLPRSVSEEVLALEGRFHPGTIGSDNSQDDSRTRRSKVQQHRERSETDPMTLSIDRPPVNRRPQGSRENRRKKKPRSTAFASTDENNYEGDGEISDVFQVDKEDIIASSDVNQSSTKLHSVHSYFTAATALPSQPTDILFIEKKDGQGFVKEHKSRMKRSHDQTSYAMQLLDIDKNYTTLDFVLKIHLAFRSLAMIGHGLLAGLAISQCIFVYSLKSNGSRVLLEYYYILSIPYHSVYYFLLAFSTVSILDRYVNISSGWSQFFLVLFTKPSRALAVVAYLLALVFSVSLAQLDDRISLQKDLPELWTNSDMDRLDTWIVINLLRVIGSVLGWVMVALAPTDDQTASTIRGGIEQENGEGSVRYEMNSLKSTPVHTWDRINP